MVVGDSFDFFETNPKRCMHVKGVTAKISLSLNLVPHLGDESLELGPSVKVFKEENDLNNHIHGLILGPSARDSSSRCSTRLRLTETVSVTFLLFFPLI